MINLEMMQGWPEAVNWTAVCALAWSMQLNFRNLLGNNIGGNQGVKGKDVINCVSGCQCSL